MDETVSTTPAVETPATAETTLEVAPAVETNEAEGLGGLGGNTPETNESDSQEQPNDFLGAPEGDYSNDGFNLPEGVELDDGVIDGVKEWCKENNISQKGYQGLIERMTPVLERRQMEKIAEVKKEFLSTWQSDPELGGAKFNQVRDAASKAYEKFVDAETRELLQQTGLNCHPGIVKAFYQIQQAISDDTVVRGSRPSSKPSLASFFNNSKMN